MVNQKKPSPSLVTLCTLLKREDVIQSTMLEAKAFLKEMEPLHKVLLRFSDYSHAPLATSVWASIEDVRVHGQTLAKQGKTEFKAAFEHHAGRLRQRHDMRFWERVRWLHPLFMRATRGSTPPPTAEDMSRDLQVQIDADEWAKYCTCTDFKWKGMSHEGDWWSGIGGEMFPLLKGPAHSLIWVPTVVTQCDSMLSVLGAKFNSRQARLAPHVAANQLFMRCNARYLLPSDEPEMTDSSSSDDD